MQNAIIQVASLKPGCFFATTYWNMLSANEAMLEFIALNDVQEDMRTLLGKHVFLQNDSLTFCYPSVLGDKVANQAIQALTWYGPQFNVVYASKNPTCLTLLWSCYEVEDDYLSVSELIDCACQKMARVASFNPHEKKHMWCFSQDADFVVSYTPV